jgi:hypothetical protein
MRLRTRMLGLPVSAHAAVVKLSPYLSESFAWAASRRLVTISAMRRFLVAPMFIHRKMSRNSA